MERLFFAIPVLKSYANNLSLYQNVLYQSLVEHSTNLRLTPRENLHITLVFIGETTHDNKSIIIKEIQKATEGLNSFTLTPKSITQLPDEKNSSSICLAFKDSEEFKTLQSKIYKAVHSVQPTKPPKPIIHTTLMQAKDVNIDEKFKLPDAEFSPLRVNSFTLFKSTLGENGSIYAELGDFSLK